MIHDSGQNDGVLAAMLSVLTFNVLILLHSILVAAGLDVNNFMDSLDGVPVLDTSNAQVV